MANLTTDTGLDVIVEIILDDPSLDQRLTTSEIQAGAAAAAGLNALLVEGIEETGVANNGVINGADVRELNDWMKDNHYSELVNLHGDDPDTGFHIVRGPSYWSPAELFGQKAIWTVADGIYHTGFGYHYNAVRNQDGKPTATTVDEVGDWLTGLLEDDLATLENDNVDLYNAATTGTGLDQLVSIILEDPGLNLKIKTSEIHEGAEAADAMNQIILAGIEAGGLANDDDISAADVRELNDYVRNNHWEEWLELHGDDEDDEETGFHLVQNDGATTQLYGKNAVNTVADGIYHLGWGYHYNQVINEDGNPTATTVQEVATWLDDLLKDDLDSGTLNGDGAHSSNQGETGTDKGTETGGGTGTATPSDMSTGLDAIVDIILDDPTLDQRLTTSEIQAGAAAAAGLNALLVEGIEETGVANNGVINAADVRELNDWMKDNHYSELVNLHGDDNPDTGFHIVRGPSYWSPAELFGQKAIWTVADGIYHTGFGYHYNAVRNQDGNLTETTVDEVGEWLTGLLEGDLVTLENDDVDLYNAATTGTGLDLITNIILEDPGLNLRIKTSEIHEGAKAADGMNHILIDGIIATNAADYGRITADEVRDLNDYVRDNRFTEWVAFHGDDENDEETGFHLVQGDGATTRLYGSNAVNTVADGIYHIGFGTYYANIRNEDGNVTATSLQDIANWLNNLLDDELDAGTLLA